jgi:hypothetical protein
VIPSLIFISRSGSSADLCFVFPVPVQLVRTSLFQRPGARFSRAFLSASQFPFFFWRSSLLQSTYSVPAFRSLVSTRTGVRFAPAVHVRTVFQRWPSLRFLRERCLGRACLRGRRAFSLPAHNRRKLQASTCGPARHLCAFDFVSAPGSGTWPVCLLALWLPYVLIKEHSHQLILILILHSSVRL